MEKVQRLKSVLRCSCFIPSLLAPVKSHLSILVIGCTACFGQTSPWCCGEINFKIVDFSMQPTAPTCHKETNWVKIKKKSKNTDFCRTGLLFSSLSMFVALCWNCTSVSMSVELESPGLDLAHQIFLTSAEWRRNIFLDLLTKLFIMQPKRLFTFFAVRQHALLVCVQLTVLQGPQDVFLQSCFLSGELTAYTGAGGCSNSSCRTWDFPLLNMSFLLAHLSSLSRTLWMAAQASDTSTTPPNFVLFANLLRVHNVLIILALNIEVKMYWPQYPSSHSTPLMTDLLLDFVLLITTL